MPPAPEPAARTVYAVPELATILRGLLEDSLPSVWVQGEISNFSRPASGHWYFTLKDARAQLRCAMFRNQNFYVRPQPKDGDQVLVRGRVGLYPARGELQLVCEHLEPAGTGALLLAFEALKKRLAAEGLFDAVHKRPLPSHPRRIGLITSATGAALQDMLNVLQRRWPLCEAVLWPVPVQGARAAPALVAALAGLPRQAPVELLLLARGGGSLEDLWAFNEEVVARAIRDCKVPVVTGIGHETDTTIADFAADLRAATPTAAAERVTPDRAEWMDRIDSMRRTLHGRLADHLKAARLVIERADARLQRLHPGRRLQDRAQRLDEFEMRLRQAFRHHHRIRRGRLDATLRHFALLHPETRLDVAAQRLRAADDRLRQQAGQRIEDYGRRLARDDALLRSLSPLAVLGRGYALVSDAAGVPVTVAATVVPGQSLNLRLRHGRVEAVARRSLPEDDPC